jgi:hypothetical protein
MRGRGRGDVFLKKAERAAAAGHSHVQGGRQDRAGPDYCIVRGCFLTLPYLTLPYLTLPYLRGPLLLASEQIGGRGAQR